MKNIKFVSVVLFALLTVNGLSSSAFARDKAKKVVEEEETTTSSSGPAHFGLGVQTMGNFAGSGSAASGWIQLTPQQSVQVLAAIGATSPFAFEVGGLYRVTVAGGHTAGFHVGGGFAVGSIAKNFNLDISGVGGMHFFIPSLSNIMINADLLANLNINNGTSNFTIGGISPVLGLGIHYFF